MKKVRNTTEEVSNNPIIGLMDAMNIPASEKRGQNELIESDQLPAKWNRTCGDGIGDGINTLKEQYEKMGIKVIGESNGDKLFLDVILPEGWKKQRTDHSMWNNLVDDKGRIRATFFYKSAFYDRDAFINFECRYNYNVNSYLPESERGHYENQKVKVVNPKFREALDGRQVVKKRGKYYVVIDDNPYMPSGYLPMREAVMQIGIPTHIMQEEKVWIPKYKDSYEEHNNTPMYYDITDCKKVLFTTKADPIYFRDKYTEENHRKWWDDYEHIKNRMNTQAKLMLDEKYPNWKDINAYWD